MIEYTYFGGSNIVNYQTFAEDIVQNPDAAKEIITELLQTGATYEANTDQPPEYYQEYFILDREAVAEDMERYERTLNA